MIIEFDLARAMTAGSEWSDPNTIKGGKPNLTPSDIKAAVSMSLAGHPFAFHALMAKYCDDTHSKKFLKDSMNEFGILLFTETYPHYGLKGEIHGKLVDFAIKVFYTPIVYARLNESIGSSGVNRKAAKFVGVHRKTWQLRYKTHFDRITNLLFELETSARTDYRKIMQ